MRSLFTLTACKCNIALYIKGTKAYQSSTGSDILQVEKTSSVAKPPPLRLLIIRVSPPPLLNPEKRNKEKMICRYAMSAFGRQAHLKW